MQPPDEVALRFASAIADGDETKAVAIWQDCSPRAKLDLATALAGLLIVAWGDSPAMLHRIEAKLRPAQN
jgi:hypothetical protein